MQNIKLVWKILNSDNYLNNLENRITKDDLQKLWQIYLVQNAIKNKDISNL